MDHFTFWNPTKLIFGKGQVEQLKTEIPTYGKKVLLVYGGGSVKRNGLYDQVMKQLTEIEATVIELEGVEPNPRSSTAQKGADLCKEHDVDFILAVGGGSVIDCVKAISAAAKYDGDVWDIVTRKHIPTEAVPFGTVLTLAATGSEMNSGSVITNWESHEKRGWGSPLVFPRFSILDPVNTFTVPKNQTIYGIVDMMTHIMEDYFHRSPNTPVQDRFCESLLRTVIETAPKLINDLENYELRETILYSGTLALNGSLRMGIKGDWSSHQIEHAVSAVHDIPHGGGLAILYPNWMRHVADEYIERFAQFAENVFAISPEGKTVQEVAYEGIKELRNFWNAIGAPSKLADYEIGEESIEIMAEKAATPNGLGTIKKLTKEDILEIYRKSL